jgi:hypothetical protein
MRDLFRLIVWAVVDLFRSRAALEAEILTLLQQIIVLRRTAPKKQTFGAIDRLVFVGLYRLFPRVLDALAIVRPGTVIKWHRAGFRLYWRWKSRPRGGRPPVPPDLIYDRHRWILVRGDVSTDWPLRNRVGVYGFRQDFPLKGAHKSQ